MKKLKINEMEDLNGGSCTSRIRGGAHSEFTTSDACIICSGLGGLAGGLVFGNPLVGWGSGIISGLFAC